MSKPVSTGFAERSTPTAAYDADFYLWTQEQAQLLRELRPYGIDWENAAEEIESVGRSDKHAIASNLGVVLLHLLKLQFQPQKKKSGWRSSIVEHRHRISRILDESPSLKSYPSLILAKEYRITRLRAADETGIALNEFPEDCPFTIEQILDQDFLPGR